MKRFCLYITILAAVLMLSGCGSVGIIYTHVTTPLDTNMSKTPIGVEEADLEFKHLVVVQTGLGLIFMCMWDSAAVGDIAEKYGIETVYFADLEELHVLGVLNTYTVHIYGK